MALNTDFKILKEKRLDENTTLKVSRNIMSGRIFVEFTSKGLPKLVKQKSFQDSLYGRDEAEKFSKSIKNLDQLRESFGLKKTKQ